MTKDVCAQDEASGLGDESLETGIISKDLPLRLRGEVQFTESNLSLIDSDVNYARFPSRMYTSEIKLLQTSGSSATAAYSRWQNSQGLDSNLWWWKLRFPLEISSDFRDVTESPPFLMVSSWQQGGDSNSPTINYWYLGIDKATVNGIYSFVQYRNTTTDSDSTGHQLFEYVSWKVSDRVRVGEQAAASKDAGSGYLTPWYAGVFTTVFLVKNLTSLRMDGLYYDSDALNFQQYDAYLYQRVSASSFVRLSYRYYSDSNDLYSGAAGIMLKYYFSARASAHIGYRLYDHSEDASFNTFFGGFNIFL